jgi:hypothetical protein
MRNALIGLAFCCSCLAFPQSKSLLPFVQAPHQEGYKNAKGKVVIPSQFEQVLPFQEGIGLVRRNGRWGAIDPKGNWTIPAEYDSLSWIKGTTVMAAGKVRPTKQYLGFSFPATLCWGLLSPSGKLLKPCLYQYPITDRNGLLLQPLPLWEIWSGELLDSLRSAIIQRDTLSSPFELDTLPLVKDWRMPFKLGQTWGFVDSLWRMRISNRYDSVKPFTQQLAAVQFQGKWGFIDYNETLIIQPNYEEVTSFQAGFSIARKKGKFGLISKNGKEITGFIYDSIVFCPTGVFISHKNRKQGIIGKNGYEVLANRFDEVCPQTDGYTIVRRGDQFGLMGREGSILLPLQYQLIFFEERAGYYVCLRHYPAQQWLPEQTPKQH